jgi:hypothetical protein
MNLFSIGRFTHSTGVPGATVLLKLCGDHL